MTSSSPPVLQAGDVFCTRGVNWLAAGIRCAEWIWSRDNEATYGHAGIITAAPACTLEALWTVERSWLNRYAGQRVLIARPRTLSGDPVSLVSVRVAIGGLLAEHLGQPYPAWRLALHLLPPLAKFLGNGRHLVCSELTAKYLSMVGARPLPYTGANPDTLADEWRSWKNFDIIFEGEWPSQPQEVTPCP